MSSSDFDLLTIWLCEGEEGGGGRDLVQRVSLGYLGRALNWGKVG